MIDPISLGLKVASLSFPEASVFCPFHDDHNPSASFNVSKGLFFCFVCGYRGNAEKIAKSLRGAVVNVDDASIRRSAKKDFGFALEEYERSRKASIYNEYLLSRGVDINQIECFGIKESQFGVIFPIRNHIGDLIGTQTRLFEGNPKYITHGMKTPVWPRDKFHANDRIFLTEGVFGAMNLWRHGYNAYALMGSNVPREYDVFFSNLDRDTTVVLDDDFAGRKCALSMMRRYGFKAVWPGIEADEVRGDMLHFTLKHSIRIGDFHSGIGLRSEEYIIES